MTNEDEKSDPAIVTMKPANKAERSGAERVEPRAGTEGKADERNTFRAQNRKDVPQSLDRVRQAAKQRKKEKFTTLLHHVNVDTLRDAFYALEREAAAGVDGVKWKDYEVDLELRL
jgi:RNA-directed DNA polymerase